MKLGIIGTGGMARAHAEAYAKIEACQLHSACDLRQKELNDFAECFGIEHRHDNTANMLADPDLDAVSIVTPDASHAELSILALRAGKHVLCEKPLATNYSDALRMVKAARESTKQNMVNFSYRDAPAVQQAREIVASGELGEVVHVEAKYLQSWLSSQVWGDWREDPKWLWRLSSAHGSKGVLGDIGVHILDFASYPCASSAGSIESLHCVLETFSKFKGKKVGEYTLDANDSALISVQFASGALGSIHTTRWATGHVNSLYLGIYGTKGAIEIDLDQSPHILQLCDRADKDRAHWHTVKCPQTPSNYQRFVHSIGTGQAEAPDFVRGAEVQRMLDACFVSAQEGSTLNISQIQ